MRNPKFLGVFSKKVREASKAASFSRGTFYFIWHVSNSGYAAQELDRAFMPKKAPFAVSPAEFQAGFRLEPGLLVAPVSTPDFRQLKQAAEKRGDEPDDHAMRQLEKARKAKQIENDMRSNFSRALQALNRPRDRKGAMVALEQLAGAKEGITSAHKHMFRDFGVSLRKKSLPDLALLHAKRAVDLAPRDDHAHFNLARILGILGKYDEAESHLHQAMSLDASEGVYERLRDYLRRERALGHGGAYLKKN